MKSSSLPDMAVLSIFSMSRKRIWNWMSWWTREHSTGVMGSNSARQGGLCPGECGDRLFALYRLSAYRVFGFPWLDGNSADGDLNVIQEGECGKQWRYSRRIVVHRESLMLAAIFGSDHACFV